MTESKKFLQCECGVDGILVTHYKDEEFNEVNLAMYHNRAYKSTYSFKERLKYAWWHLRTGKKHDDELCITTKDARSLGYHLIKMK